MDWIARLENKKTSIRTGMDPTKPTQFDFNRVRVEKNNDTHKNRPYKTYETKPDHETRSSMVKELNNTEAAPSFPVKVVMQSSILGAAVDVMLWPDHATVDGVSYSNDELTDLISRGMPVADLLEVHETKRAFGGVVIPSDQAVKIESHTITRW